MKNNYKHFLTTHEKAIVDVFNKLSSVDKLIFYSLYVSNITLNDIAEIVYDIYNRKSGYSGKQRVYKRVQKIKNMIINKHSEIMRGEGGEH